MNEVYIAIPGGVFVAALVAYLGYLRHKDGRAKGPEREKDAAPATGEKPGDGE